MSDLACRGKVCWYVTMENKHLFVSLTHSQRVRERGRVPPPPTHTHIHTPVRSLRWDNLPQSRSLVMSVVNLPEGKWELFGSQSLLTIGPHWHFCQQKALGKKESWRLSLFVFDFSNQKSMWIDLFQMLLLWQQVILCLLFLSFSATAVDSVKQTLPPTSGTCVVTSAAEVTMKANLLLQNFHDNINY